MKAFIAFSQAPFMKSVITAKDTGTRSLATLPHCIFHRVFNLLTPRELARIDAVCHLWRNLNRDIVGERRWRHLYSSRWPIYHLRPHRWAEQYGKKVIQTSAFKGRFFQDGLYGHKAGVRSVRLLPKNNLLATGSLDKTVKIWDLEQGLQICTSRKHESTVRSLVLKPCDSETARLISGSDGTIRIWTFPFQSPDLRHGPVTKLTGHTGPVSSLSLTGNVLASGSWDCSVRLWSVSGNEWMLKSRFVYPDWIWAVEAKQRHFVVCCGKKLIVQDLENGRETVSFPNVVEEGYLSCCTATEDERLIITGATDGVVRLHDRRSRLQMEIASHGSGISGLSYEDPWIGVGAQDGTVTLTHLEERAQTTGIIRYQAGHSRQLQCQSGAVYSLDMCDQWIACGAEQSTVRTWDFTKAIVAAKKAAISRTIRKNRENRRTTLRSLRTEPVFEETEFDDDASIEETTPSELSTSCRQQHHIRRRAFWNSFCWGDSTDDSEIVDAFG